MLTTNALSMFPTQKQLEQAFGRSVGFDTLFDRFFEVTTAQQGSGYPPYNLKRVGEHYTLELAGAGLSEKDLSVHVEDGTLTVSSQTDKSEEEFLHQGIARRSFKRSWTLADDMIVNDAKLESGMLSISLEKIIPEEKKAKQIPIVTK